MGVKHSSADDVGLVRQAVSFIPISDEPAGPLARASGGIWTAYGLTVTVIALALAGHLAWVAWSTTGLDVWLVLVYALSLVLLLAGLQDLTYTFIMVWAEDFEIRSSFRDVARYRQERKDVRLRGRSAIQAVRERYQSKEPLPSWALVRHVREVVSFAREARAAVRSVSSDAKEQNPD